MSQAGELNVSSAAGVVDFLQGNTGGPVGPNASNTIFVVGSGSVAVAGNAGTNTLTITTSAGGMTWTDNPGSITAAAGNGYFVNTPTAFTLPAAPSTGATISFSDYGVGNITIQANTGQTIIIGPNSSSLAGTATDNSSDTLTLVFDSAISTWIGISVMGVWTLN